MSTVDLERENLQLKSELRSLRLKLEMYPTADEQQRLLAQQG